MYCNNCGNSLKDGANFCPNCGQKIVLTSLKPETDQQKKKTVKVAVRKASATGDISKEANENIFVAPQEEKVSLNNETAKISEPGDNEVSMGDVANSLKAVVSNNLKKAASSLETMGSAENGQKTTQNEENSKGTIVLNGEIDPRYTPITMWGYFGYEILFAIPLIGWIFLLIYAFGATSNLNLKNFARSYFCFYIIIAIIALLVAAIAGGSLLFF